VLNECRPNDCVTLSCPKLLVWKCTGVDGARVSYSVIGSNRCAPADLKIAILELAGGRAESLKLQRGSKLQFRVP
jgi:hypothetical protein